MSLSIPYYVYKIVCQSTKQYYFGYRTRNVRYNILPENDLWKKYFTSSPAVKSLIAQYGKNNFESQILFTSFDVDECYWLEQDFIKTHSDDPLLINSYYHDKKLGHKRFRANADTCKFCDKHIGSGNIKKHKMACELNPDRVKRERPKSPCVFCNMLCGPGVLQNHERSCEQNPNRITHTRTYEELSNCQFCGVSVKSIALGKHERKCGFDPSRASELIECEHCQQQIPPSHKNQLHRAVCPKARYNHQTKKYQLLCTYCNNFVGAASIARHHASCQNNTNRVKIKIPRTACTYCNQMFGNAKKHEKFCEHNPNAIKMEFKQIACTNCFSKFSISVVNVHERACQKKQALSCSAV
jgi:hypothetical protein